MQLPLPENENARLESLRGFRILDTPPEEALDDLTILAASICATQTALISFIDGERQWIKSRVGWQTAEIGRDASFCAYTILGSEPLVVPDARSDARFTDSFLVAERGIRFYGGAPLVTSDGYAIGTLCVMDRQPRQLDAKQLNTLQTLAHQIMAQLELRKLIRLHSVSGSGPSRLILEESVAGLYRANADGRILDCNAAFVRILGYTSREEVLGRDLLEFSFCPSERNDFAERCEKQGSLTNKESRLRRKDGNPVWVLETIAPIRDESGSVMLHGAIVDISEHKRAEAKLSQLAAIVESSDDAIIGMSMGGTIVSWNKGSERIYGYRAEEVIGKPISILIPQDRPDDLPGVLERIKYGRRVEHYETVRHRKDGTRILVSLSVSAVRDASGKITGASAMARDITEHKQAQEALRHSEQRLQGIVSSAMDAIITVDSQQRIIVFNKAAEQIFRCPASQAIGRPIDGFIPKRFREMHRQHIRSFGRTGVTGRSMDSPATLFAVRADGDEFPVEATISQVNVGGEKLFTVILRDVSMRARMEEQLRQAQKIEAVGQLAGGIAHEFHNFLGIILGYSELLTEGAGSNEALLRNVEEIKSATQRAASLTRQLLAFSRKQIPQSNVLDVNASVWEAHKLLRRLVPTNIDLVPVLEPALAKVKADPAQIQQILINLVVNARDAMPQGGKVVIETANVELDEAYARGNVDIQAGPYVMLAVTDNGCGMDAQTQARIFEPFFTTKQEGQGTGLGLSTIYGFVRQSGGHISVESEVEKGTTFRIYLPRTEEVVQSADQLAAHVPVLAGNETILLVEDDGALRRLITRSLEQYGYTVLTAKDGLEAIETCKQHSGTIPLVISDIMMPHMNGLELKEQASSLLPQVKFLFISGYVEELIEWREAITKSAAFLEKPFHLADLVRKVREMLNQQATSNGTDQSAAQDVGT